MKRISILIAGLSLMAMALSCKQPVPGQVKVTGGWIQGEVTEDMCIYKGIPFAAPPVGDLRWKEPQPVIPWEGVRDALEFGPGPVQGMSFPGSNNSEDCLYLNVWSPAKTPKDKLPVFVWIYGGGFAMGSSSQYDGRPLAEKGVILVTINYRVGQLGYFAHPELTAESPHHVSGNYGIMDQIAALQWVHDNITNFGGDPGNVTIIGQSGGGAKVCDVISMPAAKGLVHKAVALSGNATSAMDPATSAAIGAAILKNVRGDVKKLQAMPWEEYYAFAHRVASGLGGFSPVADGAVLPADGFFKDDVATDIPMILCTTSSEFSLSKENLEMENLTFDGAVAVVRDQFGQANAEEILKAYQAAFPDKKPIELVNLTVAQRKNVLATADAKSQQKAPVYLAWFDYNAPLFGGRIRAFHCSDICYWFKNTDLMVTHTGGGAEPRGVSDQMSAALLAFMRTGNPNCPEIPEWPAYTPEDAPTMIFNVKSEVRNAPDRAALELMSDFNPWRMARPAPAKK
jgi:para-nitrobenzyl esterase